MTEEQFRAAGNIYDEMEECEAVIKLIDYIICNDEFPILTYQLIIKHFKNNYCITL